MDLKESSNMKSKNLLFLAILSIVSINADAGDFCNEYQGKLETFLSKNYQKKRLMEASDLDVDSAEAFKAEKVSHSPGCVCARLDGKSNSCAVILVEKSKTTKVGPLLVVVNVEKNPIDGEKISEFSWYKHGKTAVYLLPYKKAILDNHVQEGPSKIQMPNDGIQLVAPGKSSYIFYYEKEKLKEVWLSD